MPSSDYKIGLVGFNREIAKQFQTSGLDIASHIYANEINKKANVEQHNQHMNFHKWKCYKFNEEYEVSPSLEMVEAAKKNVMDEFIRCTDRWPWSAEFICNWNDYDHLFKIACDRSYGWLKTYNIDCLIYSNIPHQGIALAQYAIAKELGIKTLVFSQSHFPGKSWLIEDWQDMGKFKTSKPNSEFQVDISPPTSAPFYMASVKSGPNRKIRNLLQKLRAHTLITLGLTGLSSEQRRKSFQRNTKRWQNTIEDSRYLQQANSIFTSSTSSESYVYFPLHLQPEMTTDVLGGQYADQALALEKLRALIPSQIAIYVKENPKQTGLMRSESFFKRIQNIPNLKFIAWDVPSFDLIKNSIAVATITGTAGWEALRMEKPVLVFGSVFWNSLPGAFHISNKPEWKQIKEFTFNNTKLQSAANKLSRFAHDGISDLEYAKQLENFDETENAKNLAKTIKHHLEKCPNNLI